MQPDIEGAAHLRGLVVAEQLEKALELLHGLLGLGIPGQSIGLTCGQDPLLLQHLFPSAAPRLWHPLRCCGTGLLHLLDVVLEAVDGPR
jgi:hypothetical protein